MFSAFEEDTVLGRAVYEVSSRQFAFVLFYRHIQWQTTTAARLSIQPAPSERGRTLTHNRPQCLTQKKQIIKNKEQEKKIRDYEKK